MNGTLYAYAYNAVNGTLYACADNAESVLIMHMLIIHKEYIIELQIMH